MLRPACCWVIPPDSNSGLQKNWLKHIAAIISLWINIINECLQAKDCFLSMTDSSTLEGWEQKTNFSKLGDDPIQAMIQLKVAQSHARWLMEEDIKDYSQWFPGKENIVADELSWVSNVELTNILTFLDPP